MSAQSPYRKVEIHMWGDEKFCALSSLPASGQSLWLYLLTNPHTTAAPGLFSAGRAAMAEELGWSLEAFDEAFAQAFAQGMVEADWKARVVWLRNALRPANAPESPNVAKAWRKACDRIPECALKQTAIKEIRSFLKERGAAFLAAFDQISASVKSKPKASQKSSPKPLPRPSGKASTNQEQEQEQEQRTDDDSAQARVAGSSSSTVPLHGWRVAALELLELWRAHGPTREAPAFDGLTTTSRNRLREALGLRTLAQWEATFRRVSRSDYLAGRGDLPAISLWRCLEMVDRIDAGEFDPRPVPVPSPQPVLAQDRVFTAEEQADIERERRLAAEERAARIARGEPSLAEQLRQRVGRA